MAHEQSETEEKSSMAKRKSLFLLSGMLAIGAWGLAEGLGGVLDSSIDVLNITLGLYVMIHSVLIAIVYHKR
jgi:hypothetical protein